MSSGKICLAEWPFDGTTRAMAAAKKRRKPADERREIVIKVLVTEEEQEKLQAAAKVQGLPVSTWMRVTALQATAS